MDNIEKKAFEYIDKHELIRQGDHVLAAVSGGADSMCMLSLLQKYVLLHKCKLSVIHINHGFRKEAYKEAEYVKEYCGLNNIPFYLKEIKPGECKPTEEEARIKRYQFIEEIADEYKVDSIALAHNANDRAETLLFNMFRGTGFTGMVSIRPQRDKFIRPILCLERKEIEEYLADNNIIFYTDATNLTDVYARNKIRHNILPVANEINASSLSHLNKCADMMAEVEAVLLELSRKALERCSVPIKSSIWDSPQDYAFSIEAYLSEPEIVRKQLLRDCLKTLTPHLKDITSEHIDSIDKLAVKEDNSYICLPYNIHAYKEYENIVLTNSYDMHEYLENGCVMCDPSKDNNEPYIFRFENGKCLSAKILDVSKDFNGNIIDNIPGNKYTKWFDYDKINGTVALRGRRDGDKLVIDKEGHHKSLNQWMIDSKIPERVRDRAPIIAVNSDILWIVGYRDSYAYRVTLDTKFILQITLEE